MDVQERVRTTVEPLLVGLDVDLVDVEVKGPGGAQVVRLYVDRDGGVDLDTIARVSQTVSPALDAEDPISGAYTLEVSSPGVERSLRRPEHFRRVVGQTVSVKTHEDVEGSRRHEGELVAADVDGVVVRVGDSELRLAYDEIEKARTVLEWGPAPRPGKGSKPGRGGAAR